MPQVTTATATIEAVASAAMAATKTTGTGRLAETIKAAMEAHPITAASRPGPEAAAETIETWAAAHPQAESTTILKGKEIVSLTIKEMKRMTTEVTTSQEIATRWAATDQEEV